MTWAVKITLHVRIGRERAQQHESSENSAPPPEYFESQGAMVERDDAPSARLSTPIGFTPAPEDARRSDTSAATQRTGR